MDDSGVFYWYACFHVVSTCMLIPWLPETKGKTLAQIQAAFKSGGETISSTLIEDRQYMVEDDNDASANQLYS